MKNLSDYDKLNKKLNSVKLKRIFMILIIITYVSMLLFYLMIVHNSSLNLSYVLLIGLGVFIVSDLNNTINELELAIQQIDTNNEEDMEI